MLDRREDGSVERVMLTHDHALLDSYTETAEHPPRQGAVSHAAAKVGSAAAASAAI